MELSAFNSKDNPPKIPIALFIKDSIVILYIEFSNHCYILAKDSVISIRPPNNNCLVVLHNFFWVGVGGQILLFKKKNQSQSYTKL